ncbi:MAG: response regulator [Desulfobacterales bacterium]|nr:response regulator [Desulfobacterales bacterium]
MKLESFTIAIIEDETPHFNLMHRAIVREFPHAVVHHFLDGNSYLNRPADFIPDLIISDYLTPGMDGIELLSVLNQNADNIPVIITTGQGNEMIAVKAMKLGAKDYLVKSGTFFNLLPSVVAKVIRENKLAESLRESERRRRELASQLLAAQENERRRISLEIHDEIAQSLSALKLRFSMLANRLRKDQRQLQGEFNATLNLIDKIIEDTRRLSRDLSPSIIQGLKLSGSIRWMVHDFNQQTQIPVSLNMVDIDELFGKEDQIVIYRIFQEALSNIRKHAQANQVSVTVTHDDGHIVIRIVDDGRGFDVAETLNRHVTQRGLGLAALDERARMLDGSLTISSQKGKGTCIIVTVPIRTAVPEFPPLKVAPPAAAQKSK